MVSKNENFIGYKQQYWWLMFSAGILFIGIGIWVLASPVANYPTLSMFFAFGMLFAGFFEIIFALGNRKVLKGWVWTLVGGVIDFLLGSYLWSLPLLSFVVMPLIMGLWMLFRGCMAIGNSLELRAYGILDWTWLLATGFMIIILSILILAHPLFASVNVVVWTSFAFIISGIFRVFLSLQLRKIRSTER
jgi:uncharacterized membrane protein HdeD (DUF308 family)